MIEFYGELSAKCKKYLLKKEAMVSLISASIVSMLFCIPIIVAIFMLHWIFIIAILVLILLVVFSAVRPLPKYYNRIFPTRITIKDETIISEGKKFCYERSVSQVKKVIDMGEWYKIEFYFPYKNLRFTCQKDLLIQGTINDFENLFEEKIIIRKNSS